MQLPMDIITKMEPSVYTVGSKKMLTNVLFGTIRYPITVRLRYCYDTVAVLFRLCAVNVQIRYKPGRRFSTIW